MLFIFYARGGLILLRKCEIESFRSSSFLWYCLFEPFWLTFYFRLQRKSKITSIYEWKISNSNFCLPWCLRLLQYLNYSMNHSNLNVTKPFKWKLRTNEYYNRSNYAFRCLVQLSQFRLFLLCCFREITDKTWKAGRNWKDKKKHFHATKREVFLNTLWLL